MIYRPLLRFAAVSLCSLVLAACSLPRPGPSADEIVAASKRVGGDLNVVLVNPQIAAQTRIEFTRGFSAEFLNKPRLRSDAINAGDTLSITVWENVDNGLLVGTGQKLAVLQEIQVDQKGNIFMPYAGTLSAAGKTPAELRMLITEELGIQTPDPQVEVRRLIGDGATINLIGGVGAQGVYPVQPSTSRLAAMIARAGGVTVNPDVATVTVRRDGRSGTVYLQDIYDNPSFDIALRAGDTIIVEEDRRSFTAMGATGTQALVPFPFGDINVVEALAAVGGLNGTLSDPTGIFIFRRERESIARKVTGDPAVGAEEPFAYVIDLTNPGGIFLAKDFQIRDGDTIYITEAPFVAWTRVLDATSRTLNFATVLTRTVDLATE
ncbi:polysaccharide biosynthesis/export family protein [Oceanibium sediminis]|uniref:polysaccharide biosynthesis/export family protein n=1 Tax=Oceanibium sediminis TaxID=2026339 RepID=UPI000DD44C78|nr:polysaccharide biosynthesis/export family protein [Oceanibium sediminis]